MPETTKKKILFATSECAPFVKTGGLADVAAALPKYLDPERFDVRVMLPKYLCIPEKWSSRMNYLMNFRVDLGWRNQYVGLFSLELDGITYYFIDNEFYFCGFHPYGEIYQDVEKFAYFSKAVLVSCEMLGFIPDVIHCHDWESALVPAFLDQMRADHSDLAGVRTVFTIHNIKFQGRWGIPQVQDITGLPGHYFEGEMLEAYGDANYMKGAIVLADRVTTVSDTYAHEIQEPFFGEGLDAVIRQYAGKLSGIVNGIDTGDFDPGSDPMIPYHYSADTFRRIKPQCKAALQERMGLEKDPKKMIFGIVSRLTDQKGFDLIGSVMESFADDNVQIAVLGSGDSLYENMFRYFAGQLPGRVAFSNGYDENLARLIYAGSDAFLMPSVFEPCGLSQLISMRYGTVPIVRETRGLKDTVEPYNEYENTGLGFSFAGIDAGELLEQIEYAKNVYFNHKRRWNMIAERGMRKDVSWNVSARAYERLYEELD